VNGSINRQATSAPATLSNGGFRSRPQRPRPKRRHAADGFTLLEVLIAMLLAMVGLIGSLAVQQTVMMSNQIANDAQVAMRLAAMSLEELNARITAPGTVPVDMLATVADAQWRGYPDRSRTADYLDIDGQSEAAQDLDHRYRRQIYIEDKGFGLPYQLSVQVSYNLGSANPRTIQLDGIRRKSW